MQKKRIQETEIFYIVYTNTEFFLFFAFSFSDKYKINVSIALFRFINLFIKYFTEHCKSRYYDNSNLNKTCNILIKPKITH